MRFFKLISPFDERRCPHICGQPIHIAIVLLNHNDYALQVQFAKQSQPGVCQKSDSGLKPGLFAGGGARAPADVTFLTHTPSTPVFSVTTYGRISRHCTSVICQNHSLWPTYGTRTKRFRSACGNASKSARVLADGMISSSSAIRIVIGPA